MTEITSIDRKIATEPTEAVNAPEESPVDAADEIAMRLYQSMSELSFESYQKGMTDMDKWTKSHNPEQVGQFSERFSKFLDYKTAAMFESQVNFGKIDKNSDQKVDEAELKAYATRPEATDFQKKALKTEILDKYSEVANYSADRWTSFLGQRDSQISGKDLEIGGGKALDSLLARRGPLPIPKPNTENPSALSKIGFGDFGGALPKLEIEESAPKALMNEAKFFGVSAMKDADLEAMRKQSLEERITRAIPNGAILEKATVQDGEGPWQSAERILSAQGDRSRESEVRDLTKALKLVHSSSNGHLVALQKDQKLVTKENFKDLVRAVKNEKVRDALLGYAEE